MKKAQGEVTSERSQVKLYGCLKGATKQGKGAGQGASHLLLMFWHSISYLGIGSFLVQDETAGIFKQEKSEEGLKGPFTKMWWDVGELQRIAQ